MRRATVPLNLFKIKNLILFTTDFHTHSFQLNRLVPQWDFQRITQY